MHSMLTQKVVIVKKSQLCNFREAAELVISVIQAKDLEPNRVTGTLDSYVKIWVTPHPSGRFQTRVSKMLSR